MRSHRLLIGIWLLNLVLAGGGGAAQPAAYVRRAEHEVALGNAQLELKFRLADGSCTARELVNRRAGRTLALQADAFAIGLEGRPPLSPADFRFREAREEAPGGEQRLTLRYSGPDVAPQLDIVYALRPADGFLRRHLELTIGSQPLPLRKVDVWSVGLDGACAHQGFGEPVLLPDTFWGLEFPAAHNRHAQGVVTLSHHPGRSVSGRFVSKPVVVGVAESGRSAERFQEYVATFAVTPPDLPLFVNYNTWWTLMPPTEKNCLELIHTFRSRLFEPYGESIDTFTIDDGWDDKQSLWSLRADRFPNGFTSLVAPLKAMQANLGLWLSPSSGYDHAPWGSTHGYEHNSNAWFLCQSGPKYRQDIVKVVTGLESKYDLAFFKFDGFSATCEATGHGHLPGPFAQEANVDAYIELLTAVRGQKPKIYLDPTCGIWLSPWWLRYADSLWGEVSGDYPDIIVPAPIIRDSATTTRDGVFRQRVREHPGFPPTAIEHLGIIVITPEKWEDNAMIVLGRGARLLTLYINPQFFRQPDRDWAFLASSLKWARRYGTTLQHTQLILGDPLQREPYGYAHFAGPRGIVALRNPAIEPRRVTVKLDESSGWKRPEAAAPSVARIVYPRHETLPRPVAYGDTLELELQAFEVLLLQLEPANTRGPQLLGGRVREVSRQGQRLTCEVWGSPGAAQTLTVSGGPALQQATCEGKPLERRQAELIVPYGGEAQTCRVDGSPFVPSVSTSGWELAGQCTAQVPAGSRARVFVLCDPKAATGALNCTATVSGQAVAVRAVRPPENSSQTHGKHTWTWFEFDVAAGRHEVAVKLQPAQAAGTYFRGEVGWWLWVEHPLRKRTLELQFAEALAPAEPDPLPLPIAMDSQRQILTIRPAALIRVGTRWPTQGTAIWLNEVAPDEATLGWGTLQRNRSVWEKPLLIAGRKFERGLGTHANSRIVYDLAGGRFKTFRALVGRDEHAQDGRVAFEVWLDGKRVFASGPMQQATAAKQVEVDLSAGQMLELRTLDGGDDIQGDHGDWADAQLIR